jgi:hypothetical protein
MVRCISGDDCNGYSGTFSKFKAEILKPGMPPFKPSGSTKDITKWLVATFWLTVIVYVATFIKNLVMTSNQNIEGDGVDVRIGGPTPMGTFVALTAFHAVIGILCSFLELWLCWYMFLIHDPPCCLCPCLPCIVIDGWNLMHKVVGILTVLEAFQVLSVNGKGAAWFTTLKYGMLDLNVPIQQSALIDLIVYTPVAIACIMIGLNLFMYEGKAGLMDYAEDSDEELLEMADEDIEEP